MSTPNIPPAFKPSENYRPNTPVRGQATTSDPSGRLYKESSPLTDSGKKNKYNVKKYMYPDDLDTNPEYGMHTAVFFINVHTAGKSIAGSEQALYDIPDEDVSKFAGQRLANLAESSALVEGVVKLVVPAGTLTNALQASKMKRLDTAISLHMPNSVRTSYNVNWGEASDEEMRSKDFLAQSTMKTVNAWSDGKGFKDTIVGLGGAAKDIAVTGMTNSVVNNMGKYLQKTANITGGNSKAEQVFEGVQFREFPFQYSFFPKSIDEAENIRNIIRLFRYHMLPEFLDQMSFMYIYPSEFNIKYYTNGAENKYLEKLSTCVLKSMDVDYTPNGQFTTFSTDENGAMPVQINISLVFQELSKPTKETSPWEGPGL
jgi:hypothetical protein